MSNPEKPNAAEIRAFLAKLKRDRTIKRADWSDYLYHFSDVRNIANILNASRIYSRTEAARRGFYWVDCAATDVIVNTNQRYRDCVRLYYRPRTPTQYHMEGIRPASQIRGGAHCPVPVFLLFDAGAILCRADSKFTNGSAARRSVSDGDTLEFLEKIDFRLVYHDDWFHPSEKDEIIDARHTEVIIPDSLDLNELVAIVCRSEAEKSTLINLMSPPARLQYQDIIQVVGNRSMFYHHYSHLTAVFHAPDTIRFQFSETADQNHRGPFDIWIHCEDHVTRKPHDLRFDQRNLPSGEAKVLDLPFTSSQYLTVVNLDGHLAYSSEWIEPNVSSIWTSGKDESDSLTINDPGD